MASLRHLAEILIECRILSRARWEQLSDRTSLDQLLDAMVEEPPAWWDGQQPMPPGLTDYQRWAIECRYSADELPQLRHDLAWNQFILLDKLGQGGQGEVFRGRQLNPPRYVALKTLIRDSEISRRRFEQEAKTMIRIHHPAVARFHLYERVRNSAGEPTDEYVIAMELVEGIDLNRLVRRGRPTPWAFAVHWTIELLGGLSVIHRSGFIHRDVKPENVMIVGPKPGPRIALKESSAKLLDFGAVKETATPSDLNRSSGIFVGTREYAPPEQWTGHVLPASDLYALGGTLFFALTGRTPFQKQTRDPHIYREAHITEAVPKLQEFNTAVPKSLNDIVQRMLAKNPEDRGTADELIAELERILNPGPTSTATASRRAEPLRPAATVAPSRPPTVKSPRSEEESPGSRGALDQLLHLLERAIIPGHLRPRPGQEPRISERVVALLRRPSMLIILVVLIGFLIWLLV